MAVFLSDCGDEDVSEDGGGEVEQQCREGVVFSFCLLASGIIK